MIGSRDHGVVPIPRFFLGPEGGTGLSAEDVATFLGRLTPRLGRSLLTGVYTDTSHFGALPVRSTQPDQGARRRDGFKSDAIMAIREELWKAVEMPRKVNRVGVLLSGGFDSTLLMSLLVGRGYDVRGYVAYHPGRAGPKEVEYARSAADHYGVPLTPVPVEPADLWAALRAMEPAWPLPVACWVVANQFALTQRAADDRCDAVVSGLGSDEVFGGYHKSGHYGWRFAEALAEHGAGAWSDLLGPPARQRTRLLFVGQACPFGRRSLAKLFPQLDVSLVLETDIVDLLRAVKDQWPSIGYPSLIVEIERQLRSGQAIIPEMQVASHAAGLQVLFPFWNAGVVASGQTLSIHDRYVPAAMAQLRWPPLTKMVDKYALRSAFEDCVPPVVQTRNRRTYTVPFGSWLARSDISQTVNAIVLDCDLWDIIGADRRVVREVVRRAPTSSDSWGPPFQLWMLYQLTRWWRQDGPARLLQHAAMVSRGSQPF